MNRLIVTACTFLLACPPAGQGPQGETGPAGPQGPAGATGPAGPTGPQGPQGPMGQVLIVDGGVLTGPRGPSGASVVLASVDGGCVRISLEDGGSPQFVCNGSPGPAGPAGATGATGPQGPPGVVFASDGGVPSTGYPGDPIDGVTFAGFTAVSYDGNLGGLVGANAKCDAEFSASHFCTDREYVLIGTPAPLPALGAWVDRGQYPGSTTQTPHLRDRYFSGPDCSFWTSNSSLVQGFQVDVTGRPGAANGCAQARRVACCRAPVRWFRGFTTAVFNGNLGGLAGANQKCAAEFARSHLCTDREYTIAGSGLAVPANGAWIDPGVFSTSVRERSNAGADCSFWTSASAIVAGYELTATGQTSLTQTDCSVVRPLTCCGG